MVCLGESFVLELSWPPLEIVWFGVSMACQRDSCGLPWRLFGLELAWPALEIVSACLGNTLVWS